MNHGSRSSFEAIIKCIAFFTQYHICTKTTIPPPLQPDKAVIHSRDASPAALLSPPPPAHPTSQMLTPARSPLSPLAPPTSKKKKKKRDLPNICAAVMCPSGLGFKFPLVCAHSIKKLRWSICLTHRAIQRRWREQREEWAEGMGRGWRAEVTPLLLLLLLLLLLPLSSLTLKSNLGRKVGRKNRLARWNFRSYSFSFCRSVGTGFFSRGKKKRTMFTRILRLIESNQEFTLTTLWPSSHFFSGFARRPQKCSTSTMKPGTRGHQIRSQTFLRGL